MTSKPTLKLDWCTKEAANYAVTKWHYSKSLPTPPIIKIGVWEDGTFIGCIIYGRGNSSYSAVEYGLKSEEVVQLVRVALNKHRTPTSRIIAISLKLLKRKCPNFKLITSYADPDHGHTGILYQALGWYYVGVSKRRDDLWKDKNGKIWNSRSVSVTGWRKCYGKMQRVPKKSDCERIRTARRHKYLCPMDDGLRRRLEPLRKPYPRDASEV